MATETITKLWEINNTMVITIPIGVVEDSNFPLEIKRDKEGHLITKDVLIKINKEKQILIIQNIQIQKEDEKK